MHLLGSVLPLLPEIVEHSNQAIRMDNKVIVLRQSRLAKAEMAR